MTKLVESEVTAGVQTIWLRRLEKKNALIPEMYTAIADALEAADRAHDIRVSVITGGDTCFTAGNDLNAFLDAPPGQAESPAGRFLRVLSTVVKPVVAAVGGPAIGVGTTMLPHCDLVYATSDSMFQMPFVNLGFVPEAAATLLLPSIVGMARASEMLLLGERFTAARAFEIGLINEIVPAEDLLDHVRDRARLLAMQPPASVRATKRLLRHSGTVNVADRMREEGDLFVHLLRSPEALEAMQAFAEKRRPDFSQFS